MSHVYRTLVSDVTKDYPGNVANKFKVKPGLRLPGQGWKVSIVSAILPKMALLKDLQSETKNLIELWFDVDGVSSVNQQNRQKGYVRANDLKALEKDYKCRTGVEFMNEVKHLLDERRHNLIPSGKKILESQWVNLEWKRKGSEPELMIHHSDPGTSIVMLKKFASKMQWFDTSHPDDVNANHNLVISYPSHTRERSELNSYAKTFSYDANNVYYSSKADFRLINLNTAFADALNLHARPLTVTAKMTANSNTVSQSLGQVYYAPQGRDRYLFTPPVEEWYDVQTNHWNEVKISLKELDDNLVTFQSDSQCLMRLHFKKEYGTRHHDVNMVINDAVAI